LQLKERLLRGHLSNDSVECSLFAMSGSPF
jgi:hypothetical protein